MPGFISENFRYIEIAENAYNNFSDNKNAFISIVFSAMYIESIINELIFIEELNAEVFAEFMEFPTNSHYTFDLYKPGDVPSVKGSLKAIFKKYSFTEFPRLDIYHEILNLISIRHSLVHLKPLVQTTEGISEPNHIPNLLNEALVYLYKNLNLISDPFGKGVFWSDKLMKKEVAKWAVQVAKNSVEFLYDVTFTHPFGNHMLDFHCNRLRLGRWKDR